MGYWIAAAIGVGLQRVAARGRLAALSAAVGLLVLVLYNQVLNIGKAWAAGDLVSPLVGQWLPFAALTLLSGVLFYRSAFVVPRGSRQRWSPIAALEGLAQVLRGGFAKRRASE